jgi:hypothetical protein
MLDWLSSKVAMTLAALLMLAGVTGFFLAQEERVVQDALDGVAANAAAYIDEVSLSLGEMTTSLSIGPPPREIPEGLELPSMAAGERYSLVLHASYVLIEGGGHRAMAGLHRPVHLWRPDERPYAASEVAALDSGHPNLTIGGGALGLTRLRLEIGGSASLETFLFP